MLSLQASKSAAWHAVPDAALVTGHTKPQSISASGTNQDVTKEPEDNLLLDVSGIESCMFGQAGPKYHLSQLLQLRMHV